MKKKTYILALAAILAGGAIGINGMPKLTASAGWIPADVVDNSVFSEKTLEEDQWIIDDGISLKDKKIEFAKNTFEDAKLLYRTQVHADVDNSTYTLQTTLGVKQMSGEKRFGVGFGIERQRYVIGDVNTSFVYVTKSGDGYVAGVCSYDADGNKTELVASPVALEGSEWKFEIIGSYPKNVTVKIDGNVLYEGQVTADGVSGYFGFLETGDTDENNYSEGYISALTVDNDYYDVPQNVNINDDFEDESINSAVWNLYNNGPYLKGVAEGEGMLKFIDSNQSTVTTKYKYSNFEMEWDIPFVQKNAIYNADGSLKTAACSWFGVMCGIQTDDYAAVTTPDRIISNYKAHFLSFKSEYTMTGDSLGGTTVLFGPTTGRKGYTLPAAYDLWDADNEGRVMNVAFTCIDGVYNLDLKWADETEYYHVFTETYEMLTGYISLVGYGSGQSYSTSKANFAYDNVKITNRDYKGNVLSGIEKESQNLIEDEGDYGYADSKSPAQLLKDETDFDGVAETGCGGVADLGTAAIAPLVGLVAWKKRRNGK